MSVNDMALAVDESLDKFELSVGIPENINSSIKNDATELLNADREFIAKLTPEECGLGAWTLQQFSWHIQRVMNRETSRMTRAEESINKIIAPFIGSLKGYYGDERRAAAIRMNDAAIAWQQKYVNAKLKVDRLQYLSSKADSLAKTLMNLKYKKMIRGEEE